MHKHWKSPCWKFIAWFISNSSNNHRLYLLSVTNRRWSEAGPEKHTNRLYILKLFIIPLPFGWRSAGIGLCQVSFLIGKLTIFFSLDFQIFFFFCVFWPLHFQVFSVLDQSLRSFVSAGHLTTTEIRGCRFHLLA